MNLYPGPKTEEYTVIKKFALALIALMLFSCCTPVSLCEDPGVFELPYAGLRFTPPEEYRNTQGQIVTDGAVELVSGIQYAYWIYCAVAEDELDKLYNNPDAGTYAAILFYAFSIGNGKSFDDMNALLGYTLIPEYAHEIGKAGDYTFYLYMEGPYPEFCDGIDAVYAEEYTVLAGMTDQVAAAFTCFEPVDRRTGMIGRKIEFTTTDLDGNAVSSDELFAKNEITMLNIWATWCGPCIGELAELQKIHLRLQDKGCGVAGLLIDTDYAAARRLVNDNGITYPIILAPGNINSILSIEGYPTTFYIGRDGTVLAAPVAGAYIEMYENTLEQILNGGD